MCPLKFTTANQGCRGAQDEEQNDADLKMSAGVAFLIVYSHYSTHWCAWSCFRLFAYLNLVFCPWLFLIELGGIGKKLKRLKKPCGFFVERMEAHYGKTDWTLTAHAIHLGRHEAHYPFGESTGQGTATCPLQSPQQQDPQNSEMAWYGTLQSFAVISANEPREKEKDEMRRGDSRHSLWTWVIDGGKVSLGTSASQVLLFLKLCPCRPWFSAMSHSYCIKTRIRNFIHWNFDT